MSKQVAVIGLGRFGTHLAMVLHDAGYDVLGIDKSAELVDGIIPFVTHAVQADSTKEEALKKLGINNYDVAVVTMGTSIQDSVMITILLKKLGVRYIVARADNELHGEILGHIGANKIIFPEKDTAKREGPVLTMKDVTDFIPLGNGSSVVKVQAPSFFVGRTLKDIGFGSASRSGAVVLMIQRGKEGIVNPDMNEVVSYIDVLIVAGNNSDIEKIIEKAQNLGNITSSIHTPI
jgi:trk system potassium uptake protein